MDNDSVMRFPQPSPAEDNIQQTDPETNPKANPEVIPEINPEANPETSPETNPEASLETTPENEAASPSAACSENEAAPEKEESTAQNSRFCPRCGEKLPFEAVFCGKCGLNLSAYDRNLAEAQAAPQAGQYAPVQNTSPLTTGDFFLILFLSILPVAGLILMIVWSFSDTTNVNRRNLCRALLIGYTAVIGIAIILYFVSVVIAMALTTVDTSYFSYYMAVFPVLSLF